MIKFYSKYIYLISLLFLLRCAPEVPQNIEAGKYTCAHCLMQIVDIRFNAQVQTTKGKIFHFDSIECMIEWLKANPNLEIKNYWVKDYSQGNWIIAKEAYFLVSPNIASPMGANLSAYSTKEKAEEMLKLKTGKMFQYEELFQYLQDLRHKYH